MIEQALINLGVINWRLSGTPTNAQEFEQMFFKTTTVDTTGSAIESSDPADFGVTWAEIQAEITRLEADYAAKQYQRDRAAAYPSIADQLDMLYHQGIAGWKAAITAVKQEYPKP